jgi:hypothetical protein
LKIKKLYLWLFIIFYFLVGYIRFLKLKWAPPINVSSKQILVEKLKLIFCYEWMINFLAALILTFITNFILNKIHSSGLARSKI